MKKILMVFGTRPEAVKMCPLYIELKKHTDINTTLCVTAQHRNMLDSVLDIFGVRPDIDLDLMQKDQSLVDVSSSVLKGVTTVIKELRPDTVLVHGDTATAAFSALAAFYESVDIGHVEAGLRTHNMRSPFPEEFYRHLITLVAKYHFAPTETAADELISDGINKNNIYITGNTVIDALKYTESRDGDGLHIDTDGRKLILLTLHRREIRGDIMQKILSVIGDVARERKDTVIVFPVHPSPEVTDASRILCGTDNVIMTPPLGLCEFHSLMRRSYMILTDSGGIQEEATFLHIPTLVLRNRTERPEGVIAGGIRLAGTDPSNIKKEIYRLLDSEQIYRKMQNSPCPFGNGNASELIADILCKGLLAP